MPKLKVIFRAATHADKAGVLALFREENREARRKGQDSALGLPYPQAFDDFVTRQANGERRYQCLVATSESGDVIGYVRALHRKDRKQPEVITKPHGRQTTLHKLVVTPAFQKAGVGKALVQKVVDLAGSLERDVVRISLPEGNPLGFYQALGFKKVAAVPGRKRDLDIVDLTL